MGDVNFNYNYDKITLEIDTAFSKLFENNSPQNLRGFLKNEYISAYSEELKGLISEYIDKKCKMTKEIVNG